eukprot:361242-Hanusia_phi.AAC.1
MPGTKTRGRSDPVTVPYRPPSPWAARARPGAGGAATRTARRHARPGPMITVLSGTRRDLASWAGRLDHADHRRTGRGVRSDDRQSLGLGPLRVTVTVPGADSLAALSRPGRRGSLKFTGFHYITTSLS